MDELTLEQQKGDQERPEGHRRRGRDDRPVDPLVSRGEDAQARGERAGLDRFAPQSRPESVAIGTGSFDPMRTVNRLKNFWGNWLLAAEESHDLQQPRMPLRR